jgi:hypothetical protein
MNRTSFIFVACLFVVACGEQRHEYRLLAPAAQFDREIAEELVEVFEENSDHTMVLVEIPPEDVDSPLNAVESGYADLGFASNAQPFREDVTTVMPLYPTVLHIFYKKGRDPSNLHTLFTDASVFAGPAGSASHQLMMAILEDRDLDEAKITLTDDPDELPDVIVIYIPISPERIQTGLEEIGAADHYELMSFGSPFEIDTGSLVDRAVLLDPRLSAFVIPVGTYGSLTPNPVVTLAVDKLLVANPELEDVAIYDLINEMRRLQPGLAASHPVIFEQLSDEFDSSDSTFVLHPGAQAFTRRDEPDVLERYSGVAEVLVTLVIGLISGTYAVVQIYNRRRKNRIDAFYTDVMALRDSITVDSSLSERESAVVQVRNLQNQAFEMLVAEKVAADESFRIFVTLSNDIIAELRKPTV